MATKEPMKLMFTSFRDSIKLSGLKVSIDKRPPKHCEYPMLSYLIVPTMRELMDDNMERICELVLNSNWNLLYEFVKSMYALGIRNIIFCDWCTENQIKNGRFCVANVIGSYIQDKTDRDGVFDFPVIVEYGDGRGHK